MACVSCLKEGDETIVLPVIETSVPQDVIPDSIQEQFSFFDFDLFEGDTPPNIVGKYLLSPLLKVYSSDNYSVDFFTDLYIGFEQQGERGTVNYFESQNDTVSGHSVSARVVGHDDCFTMYCFQYVGVESGMWKCKTATIVSGRVGLDGIRECKYAFVMLETKPGTTGSSPSLVPEGTMRIFCDGDGIAQRIKEEVAL